MKKISVVIPCYNSSANIEEIYCRVITTINNLEEKYNYEIIFADNASKDGSEYVLEKIANKDKNVKVIINNKNFGAERSCTNAFLQCTGDAVVILASDLQDPPELIAEFVKYWQLGYKLVLGQKNSVQDKWLIKNFRKMYYSIMSCLAENGHIKDVTGFGLYDKEVMDLLRWIDDPLPYTRGIICDFGYEVKLVKYDKAERKSGKSSYNFYRYFDTALWGIVSSSKKPLRWITLCGIFLTVISFIIGIIGIVLYCMKRIELGIMLSLVICNIMSLIILSLGIVAEYIGLLLIKSTKRPFTTSHIKYNFEENKDKDKMYGH